MNRDHRKVLIESNIVHLKQAVSILQDISDRAYRNNDGPYYASGIGKHLRHILEFYDQFLGGWKERINYDARRREARLEEDRQYGIQKTNEVIEQFERLTLDTARLGGVLSIKNDEHGADSDLNLYTQSTVERELQFLRFHTVHHFAIIAMILKIQGIEPPKEFGLAPSTLQYLSTRAQGGQSG